VAFGYRSYETEELAKTPIPVKGMKATIKMKRQPLRRPVAVSLGCQLYGSLPPHACNGDPTTLRDGANKRMGFKLPPATVDRQVFLNKLKEFVSNWIKKNNIRPINPEADYSVETWLANTNYPEWRKEELRKYHDEIADLLERKDNGKLARFLVKLFMKDEHYTEYKHARGIYAREDNAKLYFGPWFKLMENTIYNFKDRTGKCVFIKHVPVAARASHIYEKLYAEGSQYIATDYSSFESHFQSDLMKSCEFILYKHMLSEIPGGAEVFDVMQEVLAGENIIQNKFVTAKCKGRRMSGEMNTSLGNGFSNFMFMSFVCSELGLPVNGVIEGDDGLFAFPGNTPTTADFTKYGFSIKLDLHREISTAGFCGQLFDPEDLQIITDPRKVLSLMGWTNVRYLNAKKNTKMKLLRCKALSFAHQYPGCPIIGSFCRHLLYVTRSYDVRHFIERRRDLSQYDYEKLKFVVQHEDSIVNHSASGLYREPGNGTRLLFEELYNLSLEDQRHIESYFDGLTELTEMNIPQISENVHASWRHYWDNYVHERSDLESDVGDRYNIEFPDLRKF